MQANSEYVLLAGIAKPAGSEILSDTGFLLGVRQTGEMPVSAKVISVGDLVPDEAKERLLGKTVALPHAQMANAPHPKLVAGTISEKEAKELDEKYFSCHYRAIQVIYG